MGRPRHRIRRLILVVCVAFVGTGVVERITYLHACNPLLRVLAPDEIGLSREQLANSDTGAGLSQIVRRLQADHRPIPQYLRLVCDEYSGRPRETARFSVGCYWEGERELGKISGVVASRTGNIGPEEVVELRFDPNVIDSAGLAKRAEGLTCFRGCPTTQTTLVEDVEQQHTLANHPEFAAIPLTPLQRTKVNAALWDHQDLTALLSPTQLRLMRHPGLTEFAMFFGR